MVLHNGNIVTVDDDFSIAEAVAIKDGNIVAVGSDSEVLSLAGSTTERMDLEGKTVLPGFNDSHLHLAWPVGEAPNPAIRELGAARSIGEIVDIVRKEVEGASPGELVWIPFGPSMEIQIKEKRWPNKNDLDPVSPDNPVIVTFAADGVYVTNSMGLAQANINRRTPQPYKSGLMGEFKIDRRGNPTGVMKGRSAGHMLREPLGVWSTDILEENIARSLEADVIPYGITSLADPAMASNNQPIQHAFQRVASRKEGLPARVNLMIRIPVRALSAEACIDLKAEYGQGLPRSQALYRTGGKRKKGHHRGSQGWMAALHTHHHSRDFRLCERGHGGSLPALSTRRCPAYLYPYPSPNPGEYRHHETVGDYCRSAGEPDLPPGR
jgi:predicted amidohydrolase YtcJ